MSKPDFSFITFICAAKWVDVLTPYATKIVKRRQMKSAKFTVHEIGNGFFEVHDFRRNAKVDYNNHQCTCLKWQKSGLPCTHAIAVARNNRLTDVTHLALGYFRADNFRATYAELIQPPGHPDTWVIPDTPLMIVKPPTYKRRAGRPSNHDRIPSRGEDPTPRTQRASRASGTRRTTPIPTQEASYGSYRHDTFDLNFDLNE